MQDQVLSPSDFIAVLNQTLEFAYPVVAIEGELSNFRVSKNRWVYFDLKDETASVAFFGSVYQLPGPLEDGLMVRVVGSPRVHPLYGFSVSFQSIMPVGEGSLKKAAQLLMKKLQAEGLFAPERKRALPYPPQRIGLITAGSSAAYADFMKILNERWGGVEIMYIDSLVQGERAPLQLAKSIETFNQLSDMPEVLVMTRGGGSADDLAAFNDERVVRAVAASRIPTLVAIGHEVDTSLAELAADMRASTPTNAAQLLVPDKKHELQTLKAKSAAVARILEQSLNTQAEYLTGYKKTLAERLEAWLGQEMERLELSRKLLELFNPDVALRRGYALVSKAGMHVSSITQVSKGDSLAIKLADGTIRSEVTEVLKAKDGSR